MNIYDISKQAGVSIATVSRVINRSDKVSPSTREKVLQVIEQNSYTPNAFARSLGLNSMHTVGILCADSSDVYLASAIYYLERELRQNSYASMLCCTGYHLEEDSDFDPDSETRHVGEMLRRRGLRANQHHSHVATFAEPGSDQGRVLEHFKRCLE